MREGSTVSIAEFHPPAPIVREGAEDSVRDARQSDGGDRLRLEAELMVISTLEFR